jgi:hypothetical protein
VPAAAVPPDAGASCHSPPNAFTPLPLACPGALSPTKVYSGWPWKVSWVAPSDRLIVANGLLTAAVVAGFTGGQLVAHAPLHTDLADVSGANEYRVKPRALVSTVTLPTFAVFSPTAAADADAEADGAVVALDDELLPLAEVPDDPHAARAIAAAAAAGTTSSIRRRGMSARRRVSDLIIAFPLRDWTRPAPSSGGDADKPP